MGVGVRDRSDGMTSRRAEDRAPANEEGRNDAGRRVRDWVRAQSFGLVLETDFRIRRSHSAATTPKSLWRRSETAVEMEITSENHSSVETMKTLTSLLDCLFCQVSHRIPPVMKTDLGIRSPDFGNPEPERYGQSAGGTGHRPVAAGYQPTAHHAPGKKHVVRRLAVRKLGGKLPPRTARLAVPPGPKPPGPKPPGPKPPGPKPPGPKPPGFKLPGSQCIVPTGRSFGHWISNFGFQAAPSPRFALPCCAMACLFIVLHCTAQTPKSGGITPLPRAHAHNDYEHKRPLLDALDQRFCSVEADIWLIDGQLLVAHDRTNAVPERTLQALYLDPLRRRVEQNRGRVFSNGPSVTLLIDMKSDATNTYVALRAVLREYEGMLTRFHLNRTVTNAVTVIISGNRPLELMAAEPERLAGYDGRIEDLDSGASPHLIPLVSDNWTRLFRWRAGAAERALPADEQRKLEDFVKRTHAQGRRIRFWGTADNARMWQTLRDAGVDLINTDNLEGLNKFLTGH